MKTRKNNLFKIRFSLLALLILLSSLVTACNSPALQKDAAAAIPNISKAATNIVNSQAPTTSKISSLSVGASIPIIFGGKGKVQDQYFNSPILGRTMIYRVYLPPDYATSNKRYPVLYMLHGLSGSFEEWQGYGLLDMADKMIDSGQVSPFIIVLPMGEKSYFFNWADDGPRWGDYIKTDVVQQIDATYRTIADAQHRAIGGLSMGAFGALQLAFNNPDIFGIVGAHSVTLRTKQQTEDASRDLPENFWGDSDYYSTVDPLSLAKNLPQEQLAKLKIYMDMGAEDSDWMPRAQELHETLAERNLAHSWIVQPGEHGGDYWMAHTSDYISFYVNAFAK